MSFDPDAWIDTALEVGMRYLCFTTKHVDGFCMWDTDTTDWKITNTPYGRDVLAMLAAACHRRGVPLCLYYSAIDEHHPNYPNAGRPYELDAPEPGDEPDVAKYLACVREQVRELCSRYGEIHGFWWDGGPHIGNQGVVLPQPDPSFNALIRGLQPNALINDRGFSPGDFGTPEREWYAYVDTDREFARPIEACNSVGTESWGWRADEDYYADAHLLRGIDTVLAKGGNYLLNVGPGADGELPRRPVEILQRIGRWYRAVRESFDDTEPFSGCVDNPDVLVTRRGTTLYVHLNRAPASEAVYLGPLATAPRRATLLNDGRPVEARVEMTPRLQRDGRPLLRLRGLPVNEMPATVLVIRLEFDRLPVPGSLDA